MNNIIDFKTRKLADDILKYIELIDDILWEEYGRLEVGFNPNVVNLLPYKSDRQDFVYFLWNKFYRKKTYNFTQHFFNYNGHNLLLISEISDSSSEITAYVNIKTNQDDLVIVN